ncbi:MAG: DUF4143 domain-containing protein [Patescibacteria group bacterium]|nr:DUF4143 domain-containing protein [Patescibacteria group bacterium]
MADNPELITEIDRLNSQNSPIDILEKYPSQNFNHFNNNQDSANSFSIIVETEINENNNIQKTISFLFNNLLSEEKTDELKNDLADVRIIFNAPRDITKEKRIETISNSLEYFIEDKKQIAKIIADYFNASENEVEKYIDNQITPNTSKILVVELNDFNINKDIESIDTSKINQTLNQKWIEIRNDNFEQSKTSAEINAKSLIEFIEWFKQNGYENINGVDVDNISNAYEIISEERKGGASLKEFKNLQELEKNNFNEYEDNDEFKELFLELLEKNGYSLEKLKEIAEDNPEEVIKIISEVIRKNIEYDKERNEKREKGNISFQTPNTTLKKEKGICGDYAKIFALAKYVLEKESVPNFDKFVVLTTHSIEMDHEWNILVTVDSDRNLVISFIDLIYHDSGGELNAVDEEHYYNIFEFIPKSKSKQTVFVDEIQYLDNPSNFLKLLYDEKRDDIKIIASGSSSFYIDKKFKDSLAGRKFLFEIYPLSFDEFLLFNQENELLGQINKDKNLSIYYKKILLGLLETYLRYGGYPKVALAENDDIKRIVLEEIGSSYVKKDITDAGIKNTDKYFSLLKILAQQTGQLVNLQEIASTLRMSHKTAEEYLYTIKKSYQVAFIKPFYGNIRKELTKMPKVYFYDLGLRNFFLNDYSSIEKRIDKGAYLENIIFKKFLHQTRNLDKIKFWRTQDKNEIDFIVKNKAYEVKFNKANFKESKYKKFKKNIRRLNWKRLIIKV